MHRQEDEEGKREAGAAGDGIELYGENIPEVSEWLKASQKCGVDLCAEEVYRETVEWLAETGKREKVSKQLVEQYAMTVSRWVQCETMISDYGFLGKHPVTGAAVASPYVAMSERYMKQVHACWDKISRAIGEEDKKVDRKRDDFMDRFFAARDLQREKEKNSGI